METVYPLSARSATGQVAERPATNASSRLMMYIGLRVLPVPLVPDGRTRTPETRRPQPNEGAPRYSYRLRMLLRL